MFPLGIVMLQIGYACVYTAWANWRNGGNGPTLGESLGLAYGVAPPGSDTPNLSGQPPGGSATGSPAPPYRTV